MTIFALSTGPEIATQAKTIWLKLRKINKINTSELIDEGIILWFPGPESYTGEDMAQVHGSKAVSRCPALFYFKLKIVD